MATVRLEFTPEPAHVRTVRLVGVAVARRAGLAGEQLEAVRLAVNEACARAVTRHQHLGIREPVAVTFTAGDRYQVTVVNQAGDDDQVGDDEERITVDVSATLLEQLVSDLRVSATEVQMSWPVRRRWPVAR